MVKIASFAPAIAPESLQCSMSSNADPTNMLHRVSSMAKRTKVKTNKNVAC